MTREIDLISYLPPFMQNYRELRQIMNAENPDMQALVEESEILLDNQFILSCNKDGIRHFEALLNIVAGDNEGLEDRRARVLVRWNDMIPYTYRGFIDRLDVFCGKGNYTAILRPDLYELHLVVSVSNSQVQELERILYHMLPANLKVICENQLDTKMVGMAKFGSTIIKTKHYKIEGK